jgi:hypothetical protein
MKSNFKGSIGDNREIKTTSLKENGAGKFSRDVVTHKGESAPMPVMPVPKCPPPKWK